MAGFNPIRWRHQLNVLGLWAMCLSTSAATAQVALDAGATSIVKIKLSQDHHEIKQLVHDGYDVTGINLETNTLDIVVNNSPRAALVDLAGYTIKSLKTIDKALAPDSQYKTPEQIAAILQDYHSQYPNLTHVESIGKSGEGRDIWAIKISSVPESVVAGRPTVLFNGMHHAREVMSTEVPLDTINYLLANYGADDKVTSWVDHNDIWIVPMVNPDGNHKVWTGDNMWRKNTYGGYGVDINRNYPYAWASCNGSSSFALAQDYHGPAAASEPETQALMNLVARIQPVFDISYHSYSELVIYPYGCDNVHTPNRQVVEGTGAAMASLIPKDSGRGTYTPGTAWELLYTVDGDDIDWMYNQYNVLAYTIEVNDDNAGFQPDYDLREPTVEKLRPAWQLLLDKLAGNGVHGMITNGSGDALTQTTITAQALNQPGAAPSTWKAKRDGSYHLILNPGTYQLTFANGEHSFQRQVTIGSQRVELNVQMK